MEALTHTVTVRTGDRHKVLEVPDGANLLSVLRDADMAPPVYCGGQGTCGKCKVVVNGREVLSCTTLVEEDMTVEVAHAAQAEQARVLTASATTQTANANQNVNVAVDIGTTTIAMYLLDEAGNVLATEGFLNPQSVYGADVVSRIRVAAASEKDRLAMQDLVREALYKGETTLCQKAGMSVNRIQKRCVVGNPAMQQLYMGLPVNNLIEIPYHPVITEASTYSAFSHMISDVKGRERKGTTELVIPDISAYVGADTVAGILSCGMMASNEPVLLVDIGTNGEMALWSGKRPSDGVKPNRLFVCATAAGPALEGASISCGMRAGVGAIDHVEIENGKLKAHVIQDAQSEEIPAAGICGSGLVDVIACALELGLLDKRGKILTDNQKINLRDEVALSQEDIRSFQSAKGAIAAGVEILLKEAGLGATDVPRLLLAGAFGSFINADNACRIGLIPEAFQGKIESIGNSAGLGACQMVTDSHKLAQADIIAHSAEMVELGTHPDFDRAFAKNMYFTI